MRKVTAAIAIALAMGTAPAGADGPAPGDAAAVRERHAAEWLRERARLGGDLPHAARKDAAEVWADWADLVDAGDLDGDGANDVVDVRSRLEYDDSFGFRETVRIEAYRGRDGKALWSIAPPTSSFVFPVVTTVGIDGKPGVVVVSYHTAEDGADHGGGGALAATVTSYDRTGTPLWSRPLNASYAYATSAFAAQQTDVEGLIDAFAGGGKDLLLKTLMITETGDPVGQQPAAMQFSVLDAATGAVRPVGQPVTTDYPSADAMASGDLGGDGLDDIVAEVVNGSTVGLVALSSADGKELWRLPKLATTDSESFLMRLPDVTGDGRADLAAETVDFGGGIIIIGGPGKPSGPPAPPMSRISLIDGARGTVLWTKAGSSLMVLGNVDRRGATDLALGTPSYSRSRAGFTVTALTGAGRKLWSVTRSVKGTDIDRSSFGVIGDVGGDGVSDIGYALVTGYGKKAKRDEGSINGRTGRVLRDPRPDMFATRAALDGRGSDAYEAIPGRNAFTVHAWRGDRPARLWSVSVRAAGRFDHALPTSVDGDKCGDLALTLGDGTAYRSFVFSGATGQPLWQLDRAGNAAGTTGAASVVSRKVFAKSC